MPTRVFIVDDHQIVRQGLTMLLERAGMELAGEAADGQQALRMVAELDPDVTVLDVGLPVLNGLETAAEMVKLRPKMPIIMLTMYYDRQHVLRSLRAGARGVVSKAHAADQLVRAIRDVQRGKIHLSPEMSEVVIDAFQNQDEGEREMLTPRELQVLQLVAEGKSMKEVAAALMISVKTAETHRAHTMEKLDIHETASLVRYAIRRGLLQA
jgi:DNA-binding NarL/FixJ family response regulator